MTLFLLVIALSIPFLVDRGRGEARAVAGDPGERAVDRESRDGGLDPCVPREEVRGRYRAPQEVLRLPADLERRSGMFRSPA